MNKTIDQSQDVILVSVGLYDLEGWEQFFKNKVSTLAVISIIYPYSKGMTSKCRLYQQGRIVREFTIPYLRIPSVSFLQFLFKPIFLIVAFFSVIYAISRLKRRYHVFLGGGYPWALEGLFFKKFKLVHNVIYYAGDYFPIPPKRKLQQLFPRLTQLIDNFCTNHSDVVWNVSSRVVEIKKRNKVINSHSPPQIIVPNGLNAKLIYQKPLNQINPGNIGFIGIIRLLQGLDLLLESLPEIKKFIPDVKLNVIGTGPDEMRIKEIVRNAGLENNVIFWGFVADEVKVKEILSNCSIGVAPYFPSVENYTQFTEPGKVKKYLTYGLPVIVTKVPAMAAEIESCRAGIAIKYDKTELVAAVSKLLGDKELLNEYRKNALKLALDYDSQVNFDKAWTKSLIIFKNRGNKA